MSNRISWIQSAYSDEYYGTKKNAKESSEVALIKLETLNHRGENIDEVFASGNSYNKENFHEYFVLYNCKNQKLAMYLANTMHVGFVID